MLILYVVSSIQGVMGIMIIVLLSIIGLFKQLYIYNSIDKSIMKVVIIIITIISISSLSNNFNSLFYFFMELKIFLLFLLPYFFRSFFEKEFFNVFEFIRFFLISVLIVTFFGLVILNETRYTAFLGLSIYVSYIVSFIYYYFYSKLDYKFVVIILIDIILLGSKMGIILFYLVILLKQKSKKHKIILFLLLPLMGVVLYYYGLYFRGQDLLEYKDIDRFLILEASVHYIVNNFAFYNYFVGLGPGFELEGFKTSSAAFNTWFLYSFTHGHMYAYVMHNEFLRLFYSYGTIGFISIMYYLYKKNVPLLLLFPAMSTNSILFSTSFIFFISLMIAYNDKGSFCEN